MGQGQSHEVMDRWVKVRGPGEVGQGLRGSGTSGSRSRGQGQVGQGQGKHSQIGLSEKERL